MLKWSASIVCLAGLLAISPSLHAQASPTAVRGGGDIQAGAGYTFIDSDYQNSSRSQNIQGFTIWGNYGITHIFGVEAEAHFGTLITPQDIQEKSYLVGPKATYHRGKAALYGKLMFGRATINTTEPNDHATRNTFPGSANFNTYAFGGGLEYRVKHHYNLRVDLEEQKWPDFEPHTLSPILITVGVAYVIR
jgi:hypothetical protein